MLITAAKLKKDILKLNSTLEVDLHRVTVNEKLLGCEGFITNPKNNRIVYISADNNHGTITKALYRTAKDKKDYTGGPNNFATEKELAQAVVNFIEK